LKPKAEASAKAKDLILKDRGCTVKELELRAKAEDCVARPRI